MELVVHGRNGRIWSKDSYFSLDSLLAVIGFSADMAPVGDIRRLRRALTAAIVAGMAIPSPSYAAAQGPAREATPTRSAIVTAITSRVNVDGALDEEIWSQAPKIGDLTQRQPVVGAPPTERTEVTLLHDADNLYVGVMCFDSEPQRILAARMARDSSLASDDYISIVLDTYRDRRNGFYFSTNPAGALVDGLVFANGQTNLEWEGTWTVHTRRTSRGWSAEFEIPFKSLSFPADGTVWGFNITRNIQRKLEEDRWSGARLEVQFFQVSEAGEITNLGGATQGVGLEVRPFAGGRWLHRAADGVNTTTGKPGFDMFYNFTPSLKLNATVNTDFGETEVDTRQINLSRFSLFFPEKRTFFLENAGVFSFSNTSVQEPGYLSPTNSLVIPFFSRRIGLLNGEEVPIDIGAKLTGKAGRTDVGVLGARTGDLRNITAKNFFVGRLKQNFLRQSYVGVIVANGNPSGMLTSNTFGADVRLATSRFMGKPRNVVFNAYGLKSVNHGTVGRDGSYGVSLEYPNDLVELEVRWREVQKNFRPALGFVSRSNVDVLRIGGRYNPRPKNFLNLQQIYNGVFYNRVTRLDKGQVESQNIFFTIPADWHFQSGDSLHAFLVPDIRYERLFDRFEISPGVVLPVGEYKFTRWITWIATAGKRRVQGSAKWQFGTYWSGHADELVTTFTFDMPPHFTLSLNTNQTFARLPQGHFVARILTSQVNYAASPFLSFSNLIQFDNLSRNLGWQSRVRWILRPGNDVFLVFGQGWVQEDDGGGVRFRAQDTKLSAKFQYAFRF